MGLSKLEITEAEVTTAIGYAENMTTYLQESSQKAKTLLSKVKGSGWEGDAEKSFTAYLTLLQEYHADLYSASKKQKIALKEITKGISSYGSNAEVAKVKSL
ncbi:WXG100 family type VII secretion target [Enterococcus sp. LJL51]|uniref:WXG100 family type VII secretion target n=1 Tax=Enterococcus sp. LJL51 TaxID=3416656 RepID=UPI003CE81006